MKEKLYIFVMKRINAFKSMLLFVYIKKTNSDTCLDEKLRIHELKESKKHLQSGSVLSNRVLWIIFRLKFSKLS
jgi:hypothetical protein